MCFAPQTGNRSCLPSHNHDDTQVDGRKGCVATYRVVCDAGESMLDQGACAGVTQHHSNVHAFSNTNEHAHERQKPHLRERTTSPSRRGKTLEVESAPGNHTTIAAVSASLLI